jgi:hypothetical protein
MDLQVSTASLDIATAQPLLTDVSRADAEYGRC